MGRGAWVESRAVGVGTVWLSSTAPQVKRCGVD